MVGVKILFQPYSLCTSTSYKKESGIVNFASDMKSRSPILLPYCSQARIKSGTLWFDAQHAVARYGQPTYRQLLHGCCGTTVVTLELHGSPQLHAVAYGLESAYTTDLAVGNLCQRGCMGQTLESWVLEARCWHQ